MQRARLAELPLRLQGVITSYSIHYTKLYDNEIGCHHAQLVVGDFHDGGVRRNGTDDVGVCDRITWHRLALIGGRGAANGTLLVDLAVP